MQNKEPVFNEHGVATLNYYHREHKLDNKNKFTIKAMCINDNRYASISMGGKDRYSWSPLTKEWDYSESLAEVLVIMLREIYNKFKAHETFTDAKLKKLFSGFAWIRTSSEETILEKLFTFKDEYDEIDEAVHQWMKQAKEKPQQDLPKQWELVTCVDTSVFSQLTNSQEYEVIDAREITMWKTEYTMYKIKTPWTLNWEWVFRAELFTLKK